MGKPEIKMNASNETKPPCDDCQMLQREFAANPGGKKMTSTGWILLGITGKEHSWPLYVPIYPKLFSKCVSGGSAVALSALCLPFVTPALRKVCLPYVPATTVQVENVFKALKGRTGQLVDIGSGDGRIVSLSGIF